MPIEKIENLNKNIVKTSFRKTPRMSTYHVAFLVSDFEHIQNADKSLTIFARPNVIKDAGFALEEGEKVLKELSNYLKINLPIKKLKILASTKLGPAGYENWGLIFIRYIYILK